MQSPSIRVALAQLASTSSPADNRTRLADVADRAAGADLVVLPEVFARDFGVAGESVAEDAEPLDGPFVTALEETARRHGGTWVAGMFERSDDPDRPYNTLAVVDPTGLRTTYRKVHLYDSFGFRESDQMLAGSRTPTLVEVRGVMVGLMTCYDLRFPELARELSRAGADLVVVPSAWVVGPRKVAHWQALVTARAIENLAYVAAVSQPGPRYTGHSMVVDPRGDVVAEVADGEQVLLADVHVKQVRAARAENPSLHNRRDDHPWGPPSRRLSGGDA